MNGTVHLVRGVVVAAGLALVAGCAGSSPEPDAASTSTPEASIAAEPPGDTLADIIARAPETPSLAIQDSTPAEGYTTSHVTYPSDGLTISGVLHVPDGEGPFPGVVLVHGFVDAEAYTTGSELVREQQRLAGSGYVILVPDLRGLGESDQDSEATGDLEMGWTLDVVNALRALAGADIAALDPSRVGLVGHSLGGLVALNAAVAAPETASALVVIAPSGTDLWANVTLFLAPGDPVYDAIVAQHGTPETAVAHWADLSPLSFTDRLDAPMLIVQGTADDVIPRESTEATIAGLQAGGIDPAVVWVDGGDHVLDPAWETGAQAILDFLSVELAR